MGRTFVFAFAADRESAHEFATHHLRSIRLDTLTVTSPSGPLWVLFQEIEPSQQDGIRRLGPTSTSAIALVTDAVTWLPGESGVQSPFEAADLAVIDLVLRELGNDEPVNARSLAAAFRRHGFKRRSAAAGLTGFRWPVGSHPSYAGFARCSPATFQLALGQRADYSFGVWDRDRGGEPVRTWPSEPYPHEANEYLDEEIARPLVAAARLASDQRFAMVPSAVGVTASDVAIVAGLDARGARCLSWRVVTDTLGTLHTSLVLDPGFPLHVSRSKIGLPGMPEPFGLSRHGHAGFACSKFGDFLAVAASSLVEPTHNQWHSFPSSLEDGDLTTQMDFAVAELRKIIGS